MRRTLAALLCITPLAAAAQELRLTPPSIGDAMRTMDLLASRPEKPLEQTFVLPERPGQNQVAWYGFDWRFVDVPAPGGGAGGIRLYYYKNELAQARRALPAIQSAYARLVDQFHYSPTRRIPYILFATQREFQTQNVFEVSEGVLGVTSPSDLKMSVPYFGDHARFVEVSTHEMVHQFTIQKLNQQAGADDVGPAIQLLPLWFIEGIAEYYSKGGIDTETDLFLRDLVWNADPRKGYEVLPFAEDRIRGYIPTYKLGQARIAFIADVYGKEKIQAFLENAFLLSEGDRQAGGGGASGPRVFGTLVRRVLNEPLEQVEGRWKAWMKRRYYPEYIRARQDLPQLREFRGFPAEPEDFHVSPDGNLLIVRGIDRSRGRARMYIADIRYPKGAVEIGADSVPGIESLHPIDHSVAAIGPGLAVFAAQDGEGDRVYLQPYKHVVQEGKPPRILLGGRRDLDVRPPDGSTRFIQVADPAFSPDMKELAFVGVARDGQQDIYVVSLKGGVARRVTDDPYAKRDLAWAADGIYHSSDATDHGRANLFKVDPATGIVSRLTTAPSTDRHPWPMGDGSVLFSSDAAGKTDLYVLKDGATQQITDFSTGLTNPALAPKGRGALAATFYGGSFKVVEVPKVTWIEGARTPVGPPQGDVMEIPLGELPSDVTEYDPLALKNWRPETGMIYGGGGGSSVGGRAAVLFADMLRDRLVFMDVAVLGSWDYTQALLLYQNRATRTPWTVGGFHFVQQNVDARNRDLVYFQRDFGVVGAVQYPLDRFRRFELELTAGGVQRYCPADFSGRVDIACGSLGPGTGYASYAEWKDVNAGVHFTVSPTLRFGYDTIRYTFATGPLAGHSLLLELGGGYLPDARAVHGFAHVDAQQYFQLAGRANIGFRASAGSSWAPNDRGATWQRTWWISSADNLRGFYPFDVTNLVGKHYWVANAELQVPLDPIVRLLIFDYIEGVAALDFGSVYNQFGTTRATPLAGSTCRTTTESDACIEPGAWDARTLTGVLGVNVLFGPLLLRVHFGHPFDIGGLETDALRNGTKWVTNITLRYFFW
ncbi:MAG TPA: hypothetical protein VFL83_22050 [Anaeromyxobacter sp.]|nr:hypothetical protein [Anaeromyxobacter sp.]